MAEAEVKAKEVRHSVNAGGLDLETDRGWR